MPRNKITKADNATFKRQLNSAVVEKDVENAYREILSKFYNDMEYDIYSPYQCDGYYTNHWMLNLLLEAKYDEKFTNKTAQCKTLTQAIWYIKKFQENGEPLPNVVLIGDKNECFIVYGSHLYKYLSENVDWTIAPSKAPIENNDFVVKLIDDNNICPFVFKINSTAFDMQDVCLAIQDLAERGRVKQISLTPNNIRRIYDDFLRTIIGNDRIKQYTTNDLVSIFMHAMVNPKNCYLHPQKRNVLVVPTTTSSKEVSINGSAFNAFFSQFNRNYTQEERDIFTSMADVLIEETRRKLDGSFWTPSIWADRAIEMITETLGEDWRKEYIVWDACCGSMNLTRDYNFNNLYASTLYETEISLSAPYNTNSTKFQYDFLNDDIDVTPLSDYRTLKMPKSLFEALKNDKKIVFYMNPPYGTANEAGGFGKSKAHIAESAINKIMLDDGMGKSAQQLFAQFFYRVLKLKKDFHLSNVVIAFFVKPIYMTGTDYWKPFRDYFKRNFYFEQGNLFNASDFSNVSDKWGITFSIYTSKPDLRNGWKLSVEEIKNDKVVHVKSKILRTVEQNDSLSKWIREPIKELKPTKDHYPRFSTAFSINSKTKDGKFVKGSLGYFVNIANNIYKSYRDVYLLSGTAACGHGVNVLPCNFERVCVTFASRKLANKDWINDKDEFHVPNTNHPKYTEFEKDCIVYSLFNPNASYQSSLRNIECDGKIYPIHNNWFFLSINEMKELASEYDFLEMQDDLRTDTDRFVYLYLKDLKAKKLLSKESDELLQIARKIVRYSFKYREHYHMDNEKHQLQAWDASWYQIMQLLKVYPLKKEKAEFDEALKKLENKIRPMIYELDILTE